MEEYKEQIIKLVNSVKDKEMLNLIYQLLEKHLFPNERERNNVRYYK